MSDYVSLRCKITIIVLSDLDTVNRTTYSQADIFFFLSFSSFFSFFYTIIEGEGSLQVGVLLNWLGLLSSLVFFGAVTFFEVGYLFTPFIFLI